MSLRWSVSILSICTLLQAYTPQRSIHIINRRGHVHLLYERKSLLIFTIFYEHLKQQYHFSHRELCIFVAAAVKYNKTIFQIPACSRLARPKYSLQFLPPHIQVYNTTSLLIMVAQWQNITSLYVLTPHQSQCSMWVPVPKPVFCQNLLGKCLKSLNYVFTKKKNNVFTKSNALSINVYLIDTKETIGMATFSPSHTKKLRLAKPVLFCLILLHSVFLRYEL